MFTQGPFSRAQLAEQGFNDRELANALEMGRLRRVRRGWFAGPHTPEAAVRAIQLGGRLGCLSACRLHGIWVPRHDDLHVVLNPGVNMPPVPPTGVQFHRLAENCPAAVVPLSDAISQVLHRHDEETGLIVLESAANRGLLSESDARCLLADVPMRGRLTGQHFSPAAQSGSETRLRLFFQRRNVAVQPQAYIAGVGQVDLLVGRSWIIEADSAEHHSAPRNVRVDCERDVNARLLGYTRDRLSYEQVWVTWEHTQEFLVAVLRTRRHLRLPDPRRYTA